MTIYQVIYACMHACIYGYMAGWSLNESKLKEFPIASKPNVSLKACEAKLGSAADTSPAVRYSIVGSILLVIR